MRRGNSRPGGDDTTELLSVTSITKRFGPGLAPRDGISQTQTPVTPGPQVPVLTVGRLLDRASRPRLGFPRAPHLAFDHGEAKDALRFLPAAADATA